MKRVARGLLWALVGVAAGTFAVAALVLSLLRAAPGEWSTPFSLGPWQVRLSVPALIRIATHPMLLQHLDGHTLHTRFGAVQWHATVRADTWQAVCSPCRLHWPELGRDDVVLSRIELTARRLAQDDWRGEFVLGDAPQAVRGRFTAGFDAQGAMFSASLPDTPMADAARLFVSAIPELQHARVDGRLRLEARWTLPQRELSLLPHIEGFVVAGLGTESLIGATTRCGTIPRHGFGTWLPRAVLAAEDQRFYEHSGYDLREMTAAWSHKTNDARGASTLSQQLAKLLYAGDEHSQLRKLRELLYAVELDRVLGKARVLNLYLAIAPWGDGQCGATAAARHYLHKRVDRLTPTDAAWLASLLHNPDHEWAAFERSGRVNLQRVGWVIDQLRPMPAAQRDALLDALPQWSPPQE
jgi:hypothetical protein